MRVEELIEKLGQYDRQDEVIILTPPIRGTDENEELSWEVLVVEKYSDNSVVLKAE